MTVNMAGKVTTEGNTIVITSGSPAKSVGSPSSDGGRDVRDDRTWKAYVSQLDSPISSALLVNGEDLNMAAGLGFLYDYYEVTEESNQAPASPSNQGLVRYNNIRYRHFELMERKCRITYFNTLNCSELGVNSPLSLAFIAILTVTCSLCCEIVKSLDQNNKCLFH